MYALVHRTGMSQQQVAQSMSIGPLAALTCLTQVLSASACQILQVITTAEGVVQGCGASSWSFEWP